MRVLVANDDGIHAAGINALISRLCLDHEVYVVAPDQERSATGHALTLHQPIRLEEVQLLAPVAKAYKISGTPSDCVKLALNSLLEKRPDIVVSGINHGPNLGGDVVYSGTVSAALEGAIYNVPSLAVSLLNGGNKNADFKDAAEFVAKFIPRVMENGFPPKTVLNINFPAIPLDHAIGVKLTQLGLRMYTDTYEKRVDPRGGIYYWLAGEFVQSWESEDSDVTAIRNNFISVTPLHCDLTHYAVLKSHKEIIEMEGYVPQQLQEKPFGEPPPPEVTAW